MAAGNCVAAEGTDTAVADTGMAEGKADGARAGQGPGTGRTGRAG